MQKRRQKLSRKRCDVLRLRFYLDDDVGDAEVLQVLVVTSELVPVLAILH